MIEIIQNAYSSLVDNGAGLMLLVFMIAIIFMLYRIAVAIEDQTAWLKEVNEVDEIGENKNN